MNNLNQLITIFKNNDQNFKTNYKPIHNVGAYFEKNMAQIGKYNTLLDILSVVNINDEDTYVETHSLGSTYYGFDLFYNPFTNKGFVEFQTSPFLKDNDILYRNYA